MKKIFYSILLSGMMVLSACDALDLSPEDYYGSNDFWNQKSQVEMFMTGIHADLRDKYQMPVTLGEFRSEILISDVTSMGEGVYGPPMTNNLLTKDNPGTALKSLIGVIVLVAVVVIAWAMGSEEPLNIPGYDGTDNVPFWLKITDMFLYSIYILFAATVLAIIFSSIKKKLS